MFVGHYGAAFLIKKKQPFVPLFALFLAVQWVDILFFIFCLFGIEDFDIVPNYTQSTHFHLTFMPYTHSLLGSALWAVGVWILMKAIGKSTYAWAMAIGVLSHWFLDLPVHTPDLPLWSNDSPMFGFGLWNNRLLTLALESVLLLGSYWWCYGKSIPQKGGFLHKYGMLSFVIFMILINVVNLFGPPPPFKIGLCFLSLFLYLGFPWLAGYFERKLEIE